MRRPTAVIELEGATKKFGAALAVDAVTATIGKGEIVGFVGANGAGKTTTISMLAGFISPTSGQVKLLGEVVHPWNAHRFHSKLGYASGDMELPAQLTGRQYLNFLLHQSKTDNKKQYAELCKRFTPQLNKKIHELSRGNKQKIALVAAFVTDPEIIILDEPTSGLDPVMQEAFLDLIRECRERGKTVFMSSHYLQEVTDVCSRVMLMSNGRVIQDMATSELLSASGKQVKIITGYLATKPPRGAEKVEFEKTKGSVTLSFIYKGDMPSLQTWLAGLKQLHDLEINEHSLESVFHSLYDPAQETPS